jgi:predicted  nucleic acid-binding Zn-ribbon protein
MGFFDIFKRKELDLIQTLQKDLECERQKSCEFEKKCESLSRFSEIADLDKEKNNILAQIACEKDSFQEEKKNLILQIENLKIESDGLSESIKEKRKQIVELDESILLQDFGMYSPIYDFATSDGYKDRLDAIRTEQKNMILNKKAATCSEVWRVNGSEAQGRVMTNQNIKQILRCFNDECDMLISKVKFNNVTAYTDKIRKSFDALNRMNSKNAVSLSTAYLNLKIEELQLAYEYAVKKQQEKDEQRRIREQMREEAKLQKELEEARKDIEKEQKHYSNALSKINEQLEKCDDVEKDVLLEKKAEIESHLSSLDKAMEDIDYRQANKRAGYVYIISNIGSFGENVYKIGMTRRLDPMERVDELGDASVPFKFDVHALIFSDDAPALETALHHAFENKKVNMINGRREFFNVTLDEIEEVVKANYDKTVEFVKVPEAEQYRETQKILDQINRLQS